MVIVMVIQLVALVMLAGVFCYVGIRVERYRARNGGKLTVTGIWRALK